MIVVMDSGGPDYDHIWITESLRGLVSGTLSIKVSHKVFTRAHPEVPYLHHLGLPEKYWIESKILVRERFSSQRCTSK